MAERQTGDGKERYNFPCPLCKASKPCIGHLTEHLKKFHRPLAELGPFSKRDDRLRLSSEQKENLTKTVPKNRYKSREQKYSLIVNIVAPESPMVADDVLPSLDEEGVKLPTPAQPRSLQQCFHGDTDGALDPVGVLQGSDKEEFVQYHEDKALIVAADVEGATGTESPYRSTPALSVSLSVPTYPALTPDPLIAELATYEAPFCSPSQNFITSSPDDEWEFPEWLNYEEQD